MTRSTSSITLLAVLVASCTLQPDLDSGELAQLYEAALEEVLPQLEVLGGVVLNPVTVGNGEGPVADSVHDDLRWLEVSMPMMLAETWEGWRRSNQMQDSIQSDVIRALGYPSSTAPWELRDSDSRRRALAELHEQLGAEFNLVSFSRPGFDNDRTQALVHLSTRCSSLIMCGAGFYVLLDRVGGRWVVVSSTDSWVE